MRTTGHAGSASWPCGAPTQELPAATRPLLSQMLSEVKELEHRIEQIERYLTALTRADPVVQKLRQIPGIGLLSSTAIRASVGDVERFACGRNFTYAAHLQDEYPTATVPAVHRPALDGGVHT